jgi:hypothetical protein
MFHNVIAVDPNQSERISFFSIEIRFSSTRGTASLDREQPLTQLEQLVLALVSRGARTRRIQNTIQERKTSAAQRRTTKTAIAV